MSSSSRDHAPTTGFALDSGLTREDLERTLRRRERQAETSRRCWVRAAEAALTMLPGASCSTHPAYDLWLRVEMSKLPPMDVILSSAEQVDGKVPGTI